MIYSQLNGTHEIVGAGSGFVVVEKSVMFNSEADEQDASNGNATVNWKIGSLGSGYAANATFTVSVVVPRPMPKEQYQAMGQLLL